MDFSNIRKRENYLPYIFGAMILSSISFELFYRYQWLAIIIASCFFLLVYFLRDAIFLVIVVLSFCVGIYGNFNYYKYIPSLDNQVIRVIKMSYYGGEGSFLGRKVNIDGDIKGVEIGDRILVSGDFVSEKNLVKGIVGVYNIKEYTTIKNDAITYIYRLRELIFNKIKDKLGWRRAALITSISFGYTDFLDEDDRSDMKELGLTHVIAVSGLHMALIYGIVNKIFSAKIAPFIAFIYLMFTGASTSTIRAFIMILCMNLAVPFRRNYNPVAGISLAGILILLIKPYSILEIGFQLSFLATIGIIIFNKRINKSLYRFNNYLRDSISVCLSAQIFIFPALILYFEEFSISFVLANLIISPLISIIVVLGNLLVIAMFTPFIFEYLCFIVYYVTKLMDILLSVLQDVTPSLMYLNEGISIIYLSVLASYYFYRKGYKVFVWMPVIAYIYVNITIYSPLPKIQYYREGAILMSYKGDRILLKLKSDLDINKLRKISMAKEIYQDINKIVIGDKIEVKKEGENYIINNNGNEYLLGISKAKVPSDYDIINFNNNTFEKVLLLSDKVVILD